jgi:hypothetical protein
VLFDFLKRYITQLRRRSYRKDVNDVIRFAFNASVLTSKSVKRLGAPKGIRHHYVTSKQTRRRRRVICQSAFLRMCLEQMRVIRIIARNLKIQKKKKRFHAGSAYTAFYIDHNAVHLFGAEIHDAHCEGAQHYQQNLRIYAHLSIIGACTPVSFYGFILWFFFLRCRRQSSQAPAPAESGDIICEMVSAHERLLAGSQYLWRRIYSPSTLASDLIIRQLIERREKRSVVTVTGVNIRRDHLGWYDELRWGKLQTCDSPWLIYGGMHQSVSLCIGLQKDFRLNFELGRRKVFLRKDWKVKRWQEWLGMHLHYCSA